MSSTRNSLVRRAAGGRRAAADGVRGRTARESRRGTRRSGRDTDGDDAGFLWLTPERARALLFVAARTPTIALALGTATVLVVLLSANSGLDGFSGAIAASWLAVHQVPLVIGKTSLGLLPLLPTALLLWLTARDCARAVEPDSTRADLGRIAAAALSGPLLVTAVCLAVAEDASAVIALQPPNTFAAFAWVSGLYLVAAVAGIASRDPRAVAVALRAPEWAVAGAYTAGRTVARLLGCAAAVTLISFLAHWSRLGDTYATSGNAVGALGLTLLSVAYLPNAVLGTVGVLVGSGVEFGDASVNIFAVTGGPIPAVPLSAVIPAGPAAAWWAALLLIPATVGVLGGLDAARTAPDQPRTPWATLTSAALATLALLLLAGVAGGDLGSFGHVGIDLPIFAVVTFAWLAIAGYAGLLFGRWFVVPVGGLPTRDIDAAPDEYEDQADHEDYGYADRRDDYEELEGYDDHDYDDHDYDDHDYDDHSYEDDDYEDDEGYETYDDHDGYADNYEYDDDFGDHDDAYADSDHTDREANPETQSHFSDSRPHPDRPHSRDDTRTHATEANPYLDDHDSVPFDAELLDEQTTLPVRPPRSAPLPEILDAEIVETYSEEPTPRRNR
ncbi:cell division protein PerM [Nocardia bovistercoris]|uniref:Uncharacterized protein n=1 Tax=Nocardia bovistercoris TaxID=2785916 RepID=A0A931N2L6_9NOCA|nr:DUF6350 family protein [Nocardia bovistercoris]MBH0776181.1 hypothetical protein [Nocardia bovistercoris]